MFSYRTHLKICMGLFVALVGVAAGGNLLAASGLVKDPKAIQLPGLVLVFGLFVAFGFSIVPVMVMSVLGAHKRLGQANQEPVRSALAAQTVIIWALWALMAAGLITGLPAAIHDGLFRPGG